MTLGTDSATIELVLAVEGSVHERLIAELDILGFEAFLQEDTELRAYLTSAEWTPELDHEVRRMLVHLELSLEPLINVIGPENWNERWERSVQPIIVGVFIVTPSWSRDGNSERGLIPIQIDPKMSFGTGYHATTRLMLGLLPSSIQPENRVLDAGTGTGILAIAAAKLGASSVVGFDIDPWSERNARENCERNGVANVVDIRLGELDAISESEFDVVLANIQLDVIVSLLPALTTKVRPTGRLLLSGILSSQVDALIEAASRNSLTVVESRVEGEWWAAALKTA